MKSEKAVTFLRKSNQKPFCYFLILSGQTLAAQRPGGINVFARFFQKALLAFLALGAAPAWAGEAPAAVAGAITQAMAGFLPAGATVQLGSVAGAAFMPACGAALAVTITGVEPFENAAVACTAPGWTLYVPVTVSASELVVVAARPVAAGQVLGPDDLLLRREPVQAYGGQAAFYDPAALVGAVAMMNLPAGAIVNQSEVQAPLLVKAGQTVAVEVQSGGVDVSINAVAAQEGRLGDMILLTNPSSGKRFMALVTQNGPVVRLAP